MIIRIVVGDWLNGGHGQTETFIIESNLNHHQIIEAYRKGSNVVGFNLVNDIATKHNDCRFEVELIEKLKNNNIYIDFEYPVTYGHVVYLSSYEFIEIYLAIVKLGNNDFTYKIIEVPNINIGGYGLF